MRRRSCGLSSKAGSGGLGEMEQGVSVETERCEAESEDSDQVAEGPVYQSQGNQ